MDYIYLRSKKEKAIDKGKEITRIRKIGAIAISDFKYDRKAIIGTICSKHDNFSKKRAIEILQERLEISSIDSSDIRSDLKRKVLDPNILKKVTLKSYLKTNNLFQPALKQNIDLERAEVSFQRLKERVLNKESE